ncbi:ribonuclease H1 [Penicillium taxi]|uniref:ribonuclease H1 n=1 Tax=Penicillium taxi TaxID=168475 RepID=UPI0025450AEC|nr:ribonuclease H1 [Penicillium taxi]KAJ5902631.1 ribonuclease H1 [Penicillium taxi]
MPYIIRVNVDGRCRGNGLDWAIGAAAASFQDRNGIYKTWTKNLFRVSYYQPRVTSQRAELEAIILALEQIIVKHQELHPKPRLNVKIFSDSQYAIRCMTEWLRKWASNGWINSCGFGVSNQDLIKKASILDAQMRLLGDLNYSFIPRKENKTADEACQRVMDDLEDDPFSGDFGDESWGFK